MADRSAYCICARLRPDKAVGEALRYAKGKGVEVTDVSRNGSYNGVQ